MRKSLPGTDSIVEGDIRWHHGQTLAAGQVAEFKVWAERYRVPLDLLGRDVLRVI